MQQEMDRDEPEVVFGRRRQDGMITRLQWKGPGENILQGRKKKPVEPIVQIDREVISGRSARRSKAQYTPTIRIGECRVLAKPVATQKIGKLIETPGRRAKINVPHRAKMAFRIMLRHRPTLEQQGIDIVEMKQSDPIAKRQIFPCSIQNLQLRKAAELPCGTRSAERCVARNPAPSETASPGAGENLDARRKRRLGDGQRVRLRTPRSGQDIANGVMLVPH